MSRLFGVFNFLFLTILFSSRLCLAKELSAGVKPAAGFGSGALEMKLKTEKDAIEYDTTNGMFYFVSLGYKGFSVLGKFPTKDQEARRYERGDTKSSDYQFALELTPNYHLDLFFQKYQGYYLESKSKGLIDPDLHFDHRGVQFSYVFDSSYSASLAKDFFWDQEKSSGSWMLSLGYDYFQLDGNLAPAQLISGVKPGLNNAKANTLSLRGSYGYNWIWSNWFSGVALGYGLNFNDIEYKYEKTQGQEKNRGTHSSVNLAGGYRWDNSKVGFFSRSLYWGLDFDDKALTSIVSATGFYYSTVF